MADEQDNIVKKAFAKVKEINDSYQKIYDAQDEEMQKGIPAVDPRIGEIMGLPRKPNLDVREKLGLKNARVKANADAQALGRLTSYKRRQAMRRPYTPFNDAQAQANTQDLPQTLPSTE